MKKKTFFITLFFFPILVFSQKPKEKNFFVGLWELKEVKQPNMSEFMKVPPGTFKLFSGDKELTIFQVRQGGSIITAYGKYDFLTDTSYLENLDSSIYFPETKPGTLGLRKINQNRYESTYYSNGYPFKEIWGKVFYGTNTKMNVAILPPKQQRSPITN